MASTTTTVEFFTADGGEAVGTWQFEGLLVPRIGEEVVLDNQRYIVASVQWTSTPGWNKAKVRLKSFL